MEEVEADNTGYKNILWGRDTVKCEPYEKDSDLGGNELRCTGSGEMQYEKRRQAWELDLRKIVCISDVDVDGRNWMTEVLDMVNKRRQLKWQGKRNIYKNKTKT